jgi:hypothetical protein
VREISKFHGGFLPQHYTASQPRRHQLELFVWMEYFEYVHLFVSRIKTSGVFRIIIKFCNYESFLDTLGGFFGRGSGPSRGLCLHRTAQHRKKGTSIFSSSGVRTHDHISALFRASTGTGSMNWAFLKMCHIGNLQDTYDRTFRCVNL